MIEKISTCEIVDSRVPSSQKCGISTSAENSKVYRETTLCSYVEISHWGIYQINGATKGNQMSRIQAVIEFDAARLRLRDKTLSQGAYRAAVEESDAAWRILQQAANESGQ